MTIDLRECKTASEVIQNIKEVRKRMAALHGPKDPEETPREIPRPAPKVEMAPIVEPPPPPPPPPATFIAFKERVTIKQVQVLVAHRHGFNIRHLLGKNRSQPLVGIRQLAMFVAKRMTGESLLQLGRAFGGKDHTTVLHGIRKTQARYDNDPEFRALVDGIEVELHAIMRRLVR